MTLKTLTTYLVILSSMHILQNFHQRNKMSGNDVFVVKYLFSDDNCASLKIFRN